MGFAGSQYHQGPGPLYINDPLKPFLPPGSVFYNTQQSCTNTCPIGSTGDPITVVVEAGAFASEISQAAADAYAYSFACNQAAQQRLLQPCVGACEPATLFCRFRGGVATLCGFDEFIVSTPPLKYRTLQQGGQYHAIGYDNSLCTILASETATCTWTGSCYYDALTCAFTQAGFQNCGGGNLINCGNLGGDFQPGSDQTTTTSTRVQAKVTGDCLPNTVFSAYVKYDVANQFAQLSDEDTEADAITRLFNGPSGIWSAWAQIGDGSGGTCLNLDCCLARYQQRTAFSFSYQEAEWRVVKNGLTPSGHYQVQVEIWRRIEGSGDPFVLFQTLIAAGTADGSGTLQVDGVVTNDPGYESYAKTGCVAPQ